ncbi:MAG: SDR family NAD(P)-dependent oxidoreductase [Chloroflexi bacterium]|nr:SDR family NAD(P)-dependent oxidoreductase [Chloroflexota bacterium]MDL1883703.1 SDR family oxidoreductase [Anaerolineae bacterium CFX8]
MAKRLENKVAVVTGASRGIGRASALALADEGAHVVVAARTADDLDSLAREIETRGVKALPVAGDLSQAADVNRLAEAAEGTFGRVDILVNNAGVGKFGTLAELSVEEYDWMMNANMRATFLCTKAFLPGMLEREEGWVVFVGSVAGLNGLPNETVYCASKHAQYGFARALDHETRPHNVKVTYLAPGGVDTYFAFGTGRTEGDPKLKEYLDSEDVAQALIFAVTQPPKSRVFLIGMRPMREPL